MPNKKEKKIIDLLIATKSKKQAEDFLDIFLTESEVEEIKNRLKIYQMLLQGVSQRQIAKDLGVGVATVIRGASELRNKKVVVKRMV